MNDPATITQTQLVDFLLNVAVVRPVFVWGAPGIGKSALIARFAEMVGIPCVSLLGSQLAPEDLIGVPQIVDGKSRFCPPVPIAREEPYCLFLDELNACSPFGVVLDTSGSMDRQLLGKALGAIASYADRHDVRAVRVVFCDAHPYDAGYLPPDEIAGRVRVRGRGGTVLQPGITLLEQADDFPDDGPILLITDGYCDVLRIRREHAFLLPRGHRLPFRTKAPVFAFD